ncbi:unnamed protein product [Parnassius mnemosyne]|uniref:Uncharacterized protein n=1 Tax=Parnassius mnemosyne TaxID=213953 RepID=A0AAV1M651_9NEOP
MTSKIFNPFDSDDGSTLITKSKQKKTLKKSCEDSNIKKRKVVLDSDSESEAESIKKKRLKRSSFAFDLEGDNELQEPIRAAALRSFLSRRAGSGYTLQRADSAKTGDYYVELRVYNTKEAEKLGSDRWKRSLVTLKSAVEDNSLTWKAVTKLVAAAKDEYAAMQPILYPVNVF